MENMGKKDLLQNIVLMLNKVENIDDIGEVLHYIREQFDFSRGYVYQLDSDEMFSLRVESAAKDVELLPQCICGEDVHKLLTISKNYDGEVIEYCTDNIEVDPFVRSFARIFNAKSLAVMIFKDSNHKAVGIVGLDDCFLSRKLQGDVLFQLRLSFMMILHSLTMSYYKEQAEATNKTMKHILDNVGVGVYVVDYKKFEILYCNEEIQTSCGHQSMVGEKCWKIYGHNCMCPNCPHDQLLDEKGVPAKSFTREHYAKMIDRWYKISHSAYRWLDGRMVHGVSRMDITENKLVEQRALLVAHEDAELGIYNRHKFQIDIENIMNNVNIYDRHGYLMILDMDDLMGINDKYGVSRGNEILKQLSKFMRSYSLYNKDVYRYAGDRFIVIVEEGIRADIEQFAESIQKRCESSWIVGKEIIECTVSIGIVAYPSNGVNTDNLLKCAEKALHQVKISGKNGIQFYLSEGKS